MRGSIRSRYPGSFSLILELGRELDPTTGKRKRVQRWITFRTNPDLPMREQRALAEAELRKQLGAVDLGTFAEPSKITLVDYLRSWLAESMLRKEWRPATERLYRSIVEGHIRPSRIALIPLQKIRPADLELYLAGLRCAPASVGVHHAVLHRALRRAVKDRLLAVNPAVDLDRPKVSKNQTAVREHCWSGTEAATFLATAKMASPQTYAYMCLALDSGARRSELDGLLWTDVDFDSGRLTIARQLDSAGVQPTFGPTKTGKPRTFALGADTIDALRAHRRHQLELKMKNGQHYVDFGLVFAKEDVDCQTPLAQLGQPICTLGGNRFKKLVAAAGVKPIKFHGCRHWSPRSCWRTACR